MTNHIQAFTTTMIYLIMIFNLSATTCIVGTGATAGIVGGSSGGAGRLRRLGTKTASHRAGWSGDRGSGGGAGRLRWCGAQTMLVEYTPLATY